MRLGFCGLASVVAMMVAGCAGSGQAGTELGGGSPYAHRVNPLHDPDFVPIFVNVQNAGNAKIYAAAGINMYDSIDDITETPTQPYQSRPTAETLKILGDLGIYLVAEQPVWKEQMGNPVIVAWVSPVDEPDNSQSGTGKPMPLEEYLRQAKAFKAEDPTRPFVVCFGQGVINDRFKGRALPREEYPKYLAVVDFIQYDVYPITNAGFVEVDKATGKRREFGEKHLDIVGQGVSRLRGWSGGKPVMAWIETGHIKNKDVAPTPAQTACEVWDAMVHGARGIGYFSHDFTQKVKPASALARNTEMLAQLKVTNGKLKKLARVIAAPLATEPVTLGDMVIMSTKVVDGETVVLAVNVDGGPPGTVEIPVAGLKKGMKIEALEENGRTLVAEDGKMQDDFYPYQEHIYRIRK